MEPTPRYWRIASTITGTVEGSALVGDHFGITAQKIGFLKIEGSRISPTAGVALLDATNLDFRLVLL